MSMNGCVTRIVSSDRVVYPVKAGKAFTPDQDGVFMSTALYQREQEIIEDAKMILRQAQPK